MARSKASKLLSIQDLTGEEIRAVLDRSSSLLDRKDRKEPIRELEGRRILLVFDEPSFRTRSAFELAAVDLGATAHVYGGQDARLTSKSDYRENMADLGAMVDGFYDAAVVRIYNCAMLSDFAKHVSAPLINGMCNRHHPTQALCDAFTIMRIKGAVNGPKITFVGDFTNVARSLAQLLAALGTKLHVSCPKHVYEEECDVKELVAFSEEPAEVVEGADVLITDVWTPMNSKRTEQQLEVYAPYQVNGALCSYASPDFIFMHNLPAQRGNEVTSEIIDGPNSVVYQEGVSRLHIARGLMAWMVS